MRQTQRENAGREYRHKLRMVSQILFRIERHKGRISSRPWKGADRHKLSKVSQVFERVTRYRPSNGPWNHIQYAHQFSTCQLETVKVLSLFRSQEPTTGPNHILQQRSNLHEAHSISTKARKAQVQTYLRDIRDRAQDAQSIRRVSPRFVAFIQNVDKWKLRVIDRCVPLERDEVPDRNVSELGKRYGLTTECCKRDRKKFTISFDSSITLLDEKVTSDLILNMDLDENNRIYSNRRHLSAVSNNMVYWCPPGRILIDSMPPGDGFYSCADLLSDTLIEGDVHDMSNFDSESDKPTNAETNMGL